MDGRRALVAAGMTTAAVLALGAVQLAPATVPVARADELVGYRSCDELLDHYRAQLLRSVTAYGFSGPGGIALLDGAARDSVTSTAGGAPSAEAASGSGSDGSGDAVGSGPTGTNLQEQGVDEPDIAKLRDGRLVVLTGNRLQVVTATEQPQILGSARVGDGTTWGGELLLVGERALVVSPGWRQDKVQPSAEPGVTRLYQPGSPTTTLTLFDLSTDEPRELEAMAVDGGYVSARLVGGSVRLVTTSSPQVPITFPEGGGVVAERRSLATNQTAVSGLSAGDVLPQSVRTTPDGTVVERGPAVDCGQVYHARTAAGASTLLVTTMRPGDGLAPTDRTAVTTDGDLVYAAEDRLYVATSRWGTVGPVGPAVDVVGRPDAATTQRPTEVSTELHAFDTSRPDSTRYVGSGSVPGYVMGRWALSRHDGALRVATTRQPPWDGSEQVGETSSMVLKLAEEDGRLVETGRVGGLGRTEQIRAVRYFGDIAAVVTFRQTDPLYLLDLSGDPKVLGELKVPGFSTYLHPIGDGLLLGIGQDADRDGRITGMQLSVFDVSVLASPQSVDRLSLGEGWSPALDDSRAFTYDPQRRQATFAFTGYDSVKGMQYGTDALGVAVDDTGRLHETGRMPLGSESWSTRVLTDGLRVFAVGEAGVVAGDAATMSRTGSVGLG
jgi:hypothetical protein